MPDRQHDIMHGSPAWERLANGIPEVIQPHELRRVLHDYAQVTTAVVDSLNRSLDAQVLAKHDVAAALQTARDAVAAAKQSADAEHERIHERINRRGEAHDKLRDELLHPKGGLLPALERDLKAYTDTKTGRMTGVLLVVLGGVVTSSIMLALQMGVGK